MSETDEIKDAMEMLGAGYDHPSLEIHHSETVIRRRGQKLIEEVIPAFIKISTNFKSELHDIDANALKVWLYIALSINRNTEQAHPGIRTLADACNLDKDTVSRAIKRLEALGLLKVDRDKTKYNIYEIPEYVSANKTVPIEGTITKTVPTEAKTVPIQSETVPTSWGLNQINQREPDLIATTSKEKESKTSRFSDATRQNIIERGDPAWSIMVGTSSEEIAAQNQKVLAAKEATDCFERELSFNPLPWDSNAKWMRFKKFVVNEYFKDAGCFRYFASKRRNEGQFTRLPANPKIYQDPDLLIAIWPSLKTQPETTKGEHLL